MRGRQGSTAEYFEDLDSTTMNVDEEAPRAPRGGVSTVLNSSMIRRHLVVTALVVAYVAWFIHLNMNLFNTYGEPPYDLAIFDQGLWLISHFHVPFVTVMGRELFGDHTSFVLYLFAPFYRLFPEPQGLLVLQTLLLASPSIPIYLLARRYIKSTVIATSLVATYLLNPLIQQGNLDQFHPEAFQVLFISWGIYAAFERKSTLLVIMVILSLTVKEDAALLVIPLGLWVAARRNRRLGLSIVAGSVVWAIIANLLIIPKILGSSSFYSGRLPFGGFSGLVATVFRRPGQFISYVLSQGRAFYLWQLAATAGFAFFLAPEIASLGFLMVAENLISNDGYQHQILYQYSIVLAPILVLGVLYAIAQQSSLWRRNSLTVLALTGSIWTCALWGYAPFSSNSVGATVSPSAMSALGHLEKLLPAHAVVSAWYPVVSHIDERTQIYVWPNPFFASNWGLENDTGVRLPVSSEVKYLLLPVPLTSSEDPQVFAQISRDFQLEKSQAGFGLYERIKPS